MGRKWQAGLRRRALLNVETLEGRVAPVVLTNGQAYDFTDANGDLIHVAFSGAGSAEILAAGGVDPNNSDIATIALSNTNGRSVLSAADLDEGTGSDDFTAGVVSFRGAPNMQMGRIVLGPGSDGGVVYGTIFNTQINPANLNALQVEADTVRGCYFGFATKQVNQIWIEGACEETVVDAMRDVKELVVFGGLFGSTVSVGGNVKALTLFGPMIESQVGIGGNVGTAFILGLGGPIGATGVLQGGIEHSTITIGGNASKLYFLGYMYVSDLTVRGNVPLFEAMGQIDGGMDGFGGFGGEGGGPGIHIGGNLTNAYLMFDLVNGAVMDVQGRVGRMTLEGGMYESYLHIGAGVSNLEIMGDVLFHSAIMIQGGCNQVALCTGEAHPTGALGGGDEGGVFSDSWFEIIGPANKVTVAGETVNSYFGFTGNVGSLTFEQDVRGTAINILGNARKLQIAGNFWTGLIPGGIEAPLDRIQGLHVSGSVTEVNIGGYLEGRRLNAAGALDGGALTPSVEGADVGIQGAVGKFTVQGSVLGAYMVFGSNVGKITVGTKEEPEKALIGWGDLVESYMRVQGTAQSILLYGGMDDARLDANNIGGCTILGAVYDSEINVLFNVNSLLIGEDVEDSDITVGGWLKALSVGGSFNGESTVAVQQALQTLTVAGDINDDVVVRAGSLKLAKVGGIVYGQISILGELRDIYTGGQAAVPGVPPTPGGTPPYSGWFQFTDATGALTGGYVEYVTWAGRTIS